MRGVMGRRDDIAAVGLELRLWHGLVLPSRHGEGSGKGAALIIGVPDYTYS